MLGVLVTDFTAEKVDVATQTSKELQVNIKDSKYVFDIGEEVKYSLQGTTQGRYLTGGVPPVRFSM